MGGKVNHDALINELQRTMALEESGAKRPYNNAKRHPGCDGHGCKPTCGYHGYCDFEATRHYNTNKEQAKGTASKGERHHYYKRSMRLGYNSEDY